MSDTSNGDLATLKRSNVIMKNPEDVLRKIKKIREDGVNKLQVVSDFDRTLTKQHVNGKKHLSSFGIFFQCKQIPESVKETDRILCEKFGPIEMDPHLDEKVKIRAMEDWVRTSEDLLRGVVFDSNELYDTIKIYATELRNGTKELFEKLKSAGVPVLVFSAGLGDVVEHILQHHNVMLENVKVFSNFLKYEGNTIVGYKNEILFHTFNKNEHLVDKEYFKVLKGRSNVLLLGDMTGDATMANGVHDLDTILKIGFLYGDEEKRLPSFQEAFDIVLIDDQTMDVVIDILNQIK